MKRSGFARLAPGRKAILLICILATGAVFGSRRDEDAQRSRIPVECRSMNTAELALHAKPRPPAPGWM